MFKIFGISLCLMISLVSIDEGVAQSSDRAGPSFSPWFDPEFPPRTREAQAAKPFKIFDNVYYVGLQSVSSYLITTNQGLILIDPTYDYTADLVLDSIRELGFDPIEIKYLLITHGHGDHASGAKVIQEATGARVVMAEGDWNIYESPSSPGNNEYSRIARDIVAKNGSAITLGDTTIRLFVTPGHTSGCLSMEYTVFDGEKSYKALTLGGIGLPTGKEKMRKYLNSVARMQELSGVQVLLPDHPFMGDIWNKAERLELRGPTDPHPFISSREVIIEWFNALRHAAMAKQLFDDMQAKQKAIGIKEHN